MTIFILTAGFGEGHNAAARGVRDALLQSGTPDLQVVYLDLFAECYGRLNDFARRAYLAAINHTPRMWEQIYHLIDSTSMVESNMPALSKARRHLAGLMREHRPAAVVSTYPAYSYLVQRLIREDAVPRCKMITVITDSISVNSVWFRCHSDAFLVPNQQTADSVDISSAQIHVTGFPVSPLFAQLSKERAGRNLAGPPYKILFMINSGKDKAPAIAASLCARTDVQLTVTVGRDEHLHREIEKATKDSKHTVRIVGWTTEMPALLMDNDLLISKAGGATVQESIAACCPIILSQVVPGQEEGNARLILENESGALCETTQAVIDQVDQALANNAQLLQQWTENSARLSRPDAAIQAARFVLDFASQP